MPQNSDVNPASFFLPGGPIGVLLIHGFTGAPPEMRRVANYLNARGLTVSGPLLPGHGMTADDLNKYHWEDWTEAASTSLEQLQDVCETAFVGGLSMGALLSLTLAATQENIAGILAFAAAIELTDWRRFMPRFVCNFIRQVPKPEEYWLAPEAESLIWSYDTYPSFAAMELFKGIRLTKELLPLITCPLLAAYSPGDKTVTADGVRYIYDSVKSESKEFVELNDCGHIVTLDMGWQDLAERSYQFIRLHTPESLPLE